MSKRYFVELATVEQEAHSPDPDIYTIKGKRWYRIPTDKIKMIPEFWLDGNLKNDVKSCAVTATVASGQAVFNLTQGNTPTGTAIFKNVYLNTIQLGIPDITNVYLFGGIQLSEDKKTLTVQVRRLGTVLLGIIQVINAANGIVPRLVIWGD